MCRVSSTESSKGFELLLLGIPKQHDGMFGRVNQQHSHLWWKNGRPFWINKNQLS